MFLVDATEKDCERERDFRIRHFAGDVVYDSTGFVNKNNDTLFHDLKRMLYQCDNAALKRMWPEGADSVCDMRRMGCSIRVFDSCSSPQKRNLS